VTGHRNGDVGARALLWWMMPVLLLATALRLFAFGDVPPGLYHDEAYHGLDALNVLEGQFPVYFPANNGREPLFIYLVAVAVGVLGQSPFALRLVAFFAGLLTVAATAAMGRVLFSRRVGLLAAAVLAVTLWHVHLSRVGFRAVLLPLFTALVAWQVALALRTGRWHHWLVAGVLYGLAFYTYMAVRFTPVALAAFGLYVLGTASGADAANVDRGPSSLQRRHSDGARSGRRSGPERNQVFHAMVHRQRPGFLVSLSWRGVALAAVAVAVTVAPLAVYTVGHPGAVLGRPGQVSVFDPAINGGDLWGTLGKHTLRTLGMFFVRGDRIWRHNVPWRPIFDPVLGIAFLLGLAVALGRVRRDPACAFVLIWTAVMAMPTLLAEDAPHFLRGVGVLPVVAFLPALGLDWLANRIRHSRRDPKGFPKPLGSGSFRLVRCILILPILFGLGSTAWAYFGDYARDPITGYWFERGAVALAGDINGALGVGWDGERWVRGGPADRTAYIDSGLWQEWPQVRFLVAAPEALTVGLGDSGERLPAPRGPVGVFAWPYGDWQQAWGLIPAPAEVTVEEGPLSQGDRDLEPYTTYVAFLSDAPDPAVPAVARLSEGVELLGLEVTRGEADGRAVGRASGETRAGLLRVRLRWRATAPLSEDYTVFLHYLRDGERIGQADAGAAGGYYPTTVWRPGDVVNDDHFVDVPQVSPVANDVLLFGMWQPERDVVLYLLDEAGNPAGDWIEVPVE